MAPFRATRPVAKALREERAVNAAFREFRSRRLGDEMTSILADFRDAITIGQAEAAVASGNVSVIVNPTIPNQLEAELVAALSQNLEEALEDGVEIGLRFAPGSLGGVPMSVATEAAIASVASQAGLAALGVTQQTQAGIVRAIELGLADAIAPVEVAQRVGRLAGLTPRDVTAVENFRKRISRQFLPLDDLDPFGRLGPRLFDPDTPEVRAVIEEEVEKYRDRLLLNRGRTIAETETQIAIMKGEAAFWDQAVESGAVDEAEVFKTWRTVRDLDVCPICEPLHGQTVRVRGVFDTAVGPLNGPTAHPRCRCFLQYGQLEGSGRVAASADRGRDAVEQQRRERLLEVAAVRDDLAVARQRNDRIARRIGKTRPGSKSEQHARDALASNQATIESLESALRDLGDVA